MGVREGRAFSSDLHSPNESFRISLHFKEKMPSQSAAPPRHAGQAGAVLALLACKRREQGAHASPPAPLKTCRGDFKARQKDLATRLPLTVIAAEQPNPQARASQTGSLLPKRHCCCSGLGEVLGIQEGRTSADPILQLCRLPPVQELSNGQSPALGHGVWCLLQEGDPSLPPAPAQPLLGLLYSGVLTLCTSLWLLLTHF